MLTTLDFWNDHTILFVFGLIFIPRMMLLYFGCIAPFSINPILGMIFIPRIMLINVFSAMYYDNNPKTMIVFWIIAILGDIIDTIVLKGSMTWNIQKQYMKMYPPPWKNRYQP